MITSLLPIASDMTVTVTIDPEEPELRYSDPIHSLAVSKPRDYELFALSKQTIRALIRAAEQAKVPVPAPVILEVDESDPEDVRVYGNFWYYNYNLEGKTLQTQSGGAYPGCIHMKKGEGGYEIVSMDRTTDGAGYEESAKKIFGSRYSEFEKLNSDDHQREQIRAQVIANYVAANELDITEYQDYGWDPVELPEENIDSFYSQLD